MGQDQIPADEKILNKCMDLGYEGDYTLKCIEANKHNSVTATYNLLLNKNIREGALTYQEAYECKNDITHLLRRNPRFRQVNDKINSHFNLITEQKSHSLKPVARNRHKDEDIEKENIRNGYMTIQREYSPTTKSTKSKKRTLSTCSPTLLGAEKTKLLNNGSSKKGSKNSKVSNNYHTIKQTPQLDDIGIISMNGIPVKANTSKYRGSKRMKSYEPKRGQAASKRESTTNIKELTQFFENCISKKDNCRKSNTRKKKFNSFLQKADIKYAIPKIYSNSKMKEKNNATVLLDYSNLNQSFNVKQNLNNTMTVSSYRSGSRKRDSKKPSRISWDNHSLLMNSEAMPISQQKLLDMMSASSHYKKLASAYQPMRLK